jgi:hypothetical protein
MTGTTPLTTMLVATWLMVLAGVCKRRLELRPKPRRRRPRRPRAHH